MSDPLSTAIRAALAGNPDALAIEFHEEAVNWGDLKRVADALEKLLTNADLGTGSVIGFVPRNRPSFCGALLTLLAGRRSIVMAYAFQSSTALAADLAKLNLPAVIADAQDWNDETLAALQPGALAIALDPDRNAAEPVKLIAGALDADRSALRPPLAEPMLEMLTSGTTGAPKRHPVTYQTLQRAIIGANVLDVDKERAQQGEPGTVNFPISNISGIYSYLPMAVARRVVVLMEKFNLDEWLSFVRRNQPKTVVLPPAGVRMVLDAEVPPADLACVTYVMAGTSPIDPATHRAFEDRYDVTILLSYGATEFCGAATTFTAEMYAQYGRTKFGSTGKPQPGNDVRVVDPETDAPLPAGETGLLLVKIGALGPDYIRTTDLGALDDDGFLYIKGRVDGVIMRGGFKILPASVEAVLNGYPGVSGVSVVGIADARLGQVPVAALELQPGAPVPDVAALEAHTRAALPAPYIPVAFRIVDALPRTPSLKVDLRAVRALFQG